MRKLILAFCLVGFTSCGTQKEVVEAEPVKTATQETATADVAPSAEEIASCPCGRPEWDDLPPGFEISDPKSDR